MSKIVVITGASKGIGAATAVAFAKAGYDVVINYSQDQQAAQKVVEKIKNLNQTAVMIKADVFTENGVAQLFDEVKKQFGSIDVLVNNAGYADEPAFEELTYNDIIASLSGNFVSAVLCTQAAAPIINKGGSILFNSSIYGMNYGSNPGLAIYSAGKAAIINFAQSMAEKLAPNIRCNIVAPGVTKTPAWDGATPEYVAMRLGQTLQNEWVDAEEIGSAFVFLATTPHMNAATIAVEAGWLKKFPDPQAERKK